MVTMSTMFAPDELQGVWDNGGETIDRYSVHLLLDYEVDVEEVLICSCADPTHPQGVYSMAESHQFDAGDHLGKEIEWGDLPEKVRSVVYNIVEESIELRPQEEE